MKIAWIWGMMVCFVVSSFTQPEWDAHFIPEKWETFSAGTDRNFWSGAFTDSNVTYLGSWPNGFVYSLQMVGDYVYLGHGSAVDVVDVSDPANPVRVLRRDTHQGFIRLQKTGSLLLVAHGGFPQLEILSVANPLHPGTVGSIVFPDWILAMKASGNLLFVTLLDSTLRVLDLSHPQHPAELSVTQLSGLGFSMVVADTLLYLGRKYEQQVDVFRLNNPVQPQLIGTLSLPNWSYFTVDSSLLYVKQVFGSFYVWDVAQLNNPVVLDSLELNAEVSDIVFREAYAYLALRDSGIAVIDVHDPTQLSEVNRFLPQRGFSRLHWYNNVLVSACLDQGMRLVDVSDIMAPQELGQYGGAGYQEHLWVDGSTVYLADRDGKVHILDASTVSRPQSVGTIFADGSCQAVAVGNHIAFVAEGDSGLHIYDVSDPTQPQLLSVWDSLGYAENLTIQGHWLYLVDGYASLIRLNVQDPGHPTEQGRVGVLGYVRDVWVQGDRAYVASLNFSHPLTILDVSHPDTIQWIGELQANFGCHSVAVVGNYALLGASDKLVVVDVENEASPTVVAEVFTGGVNREIWVEGSYAYVANSYLGLLVFEMSDPLHPHMVARFRSNSYPSAVQVEQGNIFLADGVSGLKVLALNPALSIGRKTQTTSLSFTLYPNFPNPFNPETRIEYEIDRQLDVHLTIFNPLGQLVREEWFTHQEAGRHSYVWDGRDRWGNPVASGLYLFRISAGGVQRSGKMLLIR